LASLILVVNVVGELQRKRTLAASRGFLAAARLSCFIFVSGCGHRSLWLMLITPTTSAMLCTVRPLLWR